jgi:hypothetical protein
MNLCDLLLRSARCFRTSWEIPRLRTDQEERSERASRPAEAATGTTAAQSGAADSARDNGSYDY